jgi:putative toxin-antitoxin system antitoxin component (TIGR02293 family)
MARGEKRETGAAVKRAKPRHYKVSDGATTNGIAGDHRAVKGGKVLNEGKDITAVKDNKLGEVYIQYGMGTPVINQSHRNRSGLLGGSVHVVPVSEKISIIKNGISKKELESIKKESDLDYEILSGILSVSKAKLHSKKGADKFDQNTSERIMLLADVLAYGQSVFEDKDSFNEWLKANNKALGNKRPIELMDTIYGIDEVKKEIGRIEYGVF